MPAPTTVPVMMYGTLDGKDQRRAYKEYARAWMAEKAFAFDVALMNATLQAGDLKTAAWISERIKDRAHGTPGTEPPPTPFEVGPMVARIAASIAAGKAAKQLPALPPAPHDEEEIQGVVFVSDRPVGGDTAQEIVPSEALAAAKAAMETYRANATHRPNDPGLPSQNEFDLPFVAALLTGDARTIRFALEDRETMSSGARSTETGEVVKASRTYDAGL